MIKTVLKCPGWLSLGPTSTNTYMAYSYGCLKLLLVFVQATQYYMSLIKKYSLHKRLEYSSLIHTEQPESNYTRLTQGKYSGAMV